MPGAGSAMSLSVSCWVCCKMEEREQKAILTNQHRFIPAVQSLGLSPTVAVMTLTLMMRFGSDMTDESIVQ